jgi:hypothetical protein
MEEVANNRIAMILFPNSRWGTVVQEMGTAPDGIWIRTSEQIANLRSVAMDTLILVAADDAGWNTDGILLAKEKLRISLNPKLILMKRVGQDVVREGTEVWK